MSDIVENPDHEQTLEELIEENTKWLKVIAILLGNMDGNDPNDIYEDID
jgi:hypothetical protein